MRKTVSYLVTLLSSITLCYAQTILSPGDIAITGYNSSGPDTFSFVLLIDVESGTTINFTDNGWSTTTGSFRNNEGTITWTATTNLLCGTEVIVFDDQPFATTVGSITDSGSFAPSPQGDQILAYQGLDSSPTFIYAIHFAINIGWNNATSARSSAVPPGLTDGTNAVYAGNIDNAIYNCSVTSNPSLILAAVSTPGNWSGGNGVGGIQTMPSCGFTCTPCSGATVTWASGAWSPVTGPNINTPVIIDDNYNTGAHGNFSSCTLTINSGSALTVDNNTYIEVENDVTVDGSISVQSQGNFVQNDSGGTFTLNGTATVSKTTPVKTDWFYYTYWSSPVSGETIGNVFSDVDGDRRFWFNAANFLDTDGDDVDDNADDWQFALAGDVMTPGVGYAATSGRSGPYPSTRTAIFSGPFNTGDITTGISFNAANVNGSWNLIGNPYPSAIDFDAFHTANNTVVEGTAYFWSQATPRNDTNPGNEEENFSQNDYATYTAGSGGAAGASGVTPNQYIPSGQSFFISGSANGSVTFTNAMRMPANGTSNSQFFKTTSKTKANSSNNKLWVNLTSDNGVFSQVLIAYVNNATNGDDGMYFDAPRIVNTDFNAILFSQIDNSDKKYVIQGKNINAINENEVIKLGVSTNINVATLYTLSIAQLQGDFLTNNTVYLKDNLTNTIHNLSNSDYSFTSQTGEFKERFEIVFKANNLSNNDIIDDKNTISIIQLDNNRIQFNTQTSKIKSISIYSLLGQQVYSLKGNSKSQTYTLSNLKNTVYIAKITLNNGSIDSKKIIVK